MAPTRRSTWLRIGLPLQFLTSFHSPTMSEQQLHVGILLSSFQETTHPHQSYLDLHRLDHLRCLRIHDMTRMFLHLKHHQGMHPSMGNPPLLPDNLPRCFISAKISVPIQSTNLLRVHLLAPRMGTINHLILQVAHLQAHQAAHLRVHQVAHLRAHQEVCLQV